MIDKDRQVEVDGQAGYLIGGLVESGLLYAINASVCHLDGFEIRQMADGALVAIGDLGGHRCGFPGVPPAAVDAAAVRWKQTRLDIQAANKRYQQSPSIRFD